MAFERQSTQELLPIPMSRDTLPTAREERESLELIDHLNIQPRFVDVIRNQTMPVERVTMFQVLNSDWIDSNQGKTTSTFATLAKWIAVIMGGAIGTWVAVNSVRYFIG